MTSRILGTDFRSDMEWTALAQGRDFDAATRTFVETGFDPKGFDLNIKKDEIKTVGGHAIILTIRVLRRATGDDHAYSAGDGGRWPAELEHDLKAGAFGKP
jgi:hypothetical protein